jgi:hypothetical protein
MADQNGDGGTGDDAPKVKLSFGFTKQIKSKVVHQKLPESSTKDNAQLETAEVTHIENGLING